MTTAATSSPSLIESERVRVTQAAPGYLTVTLDNPPYNLFDPAVFAGLHLLQQYVDDPANGVRVFVLETANPEFFIAHLQFSTMAEVPDIPGAQPLIENWPVFSHWLATTSAVSIAKVRGRARGIGNELIVACDLRYASAETARLGQIEVGFGMAPGGGGSEWLPRHVGRSRALEIILSAEDYDALTAERYGWVTRAVPDAELDAYVDRLARRIAGFSSESIATTKQAVNARQAPPAREELADSFATILRLAGTDSAKQTVQRLYAKAGGDLGGWEHNLPDLYATD